MPTVRKGDRGEVVKLLQEALNAAGFTCGKADGIFGKNTLAAVKSYQKAKGLKVDGIVGPKTWGALGVDPEPIVPPGPYTPGTQPPDFKQYDSRWGKKMYSNHGDRGQTMASSGCGPTAMADIVAAWWNAAVTPYDLALSSLEWGTRTDNSGTSRTFFRKVANEYKASKYATTSSADAVIECLKAGGLAVVCFGPGPSSSSAYKRWTKGGHYCCIWKWDGTHFHINDPASAAAVRQKGTKAEVTACRKGFYLFWK